MIWQNSIPTVQPSSVQKNEKKENQYQMQRGPLNSATHTKTKQHQRRAKKHTGRTTKLNKTKNMKRQVEVKQERIKTKTQKTNNNKSKQTQKQNQTKKNKQTNKQTKLG